MFIVDEYTCMGCGTCTDRCPANAIYMVDGKAYIDEERCSACGLCAQYCPQQAIQEKKVDPADRRLPFRNPLVPFLMNVPLHLPRAYSVGPKWSGCTGRGRRRKCGRPA